MTKIVCKWKKDDKALVNPDGQVWPCCYLCNNQYNTTKTDVYDHQVLKDYVINKDKYNLKNDTLKNILKSKWFTKDLPKSWENPNTAPDECQINCKVKDDS